MGEMPPALRTPPAPSSWTRGPPGTCTRYRQSSSPCETTLAPGFWGDLEPACGSPGAPGGLTPAWGLPALGAPACWAGEPGTAAGPGVTATAGAAVEGGGASYSSKRTTRFTGTPISPPPSNTK